MTYENKLESILKDILDQFDFDPDLSEYTIETIGDGVAIVGDELSVLVDRATDLIYGSDESDEDEFLSKNSGYSEEYE
jgi:hypothetical protein